jgi:hypothetical protein
MVEIPTSQITIAPRVGGNLSHGVAVALVAVRTAEQAKQIEREMVLAHCAAGRSAQGLRGTTADAVVPRVRRSTSRARSKAL